MATYPITVLLNGCRFEVFGVDEYESHSQHDQVVNVVVGDYRGRYMDFKLPSKFLQLVADVIYRVSGFQPRDQPIRVEVALAQTSPAAEAAPVLQLVPPADDEVAVIKRRMLEGK